MQVKDSNIRIGLFLPSYCMKYNTDASKNRKNKKTVISYVCRNAIGGSSAKMVPLLQIHQFYYLKLVIREVLKHAMKDKYSRIIIENDSLISIQTINRDYIPLISFYNLIDDIKRLAIYIYKISFIHDRRSVNKIIDRIAENVLPCIFNIYDIVFLSYY